MQEHTLVHFTARPCRGPGISLRFHLAVQRRCWRTHGQDVSDLAGTSRAGRSGILGVQILLPEINAMTYEDYIPEALDMVSAWDLPESEFTEAVNAQAQLMAGLGLEPSLDNALPSPYATLRF